MRTVLCRKGGARYACKHLQTVVKEEFTKHIRDSIYVTLKTSKLKSHTDGRSIGRREKMKERKLSTMLFKLVEPCVRREGMGSYQ